MSLRAALTAAPGEHLFEDGEVVTFGGVGVDLGHQGGGPGVEVGVDGIRAAPGDGPFDLVAGAADLFGEFVVAVAFLNSSISRKVCQMSAWRATAGSVRLAPDPPSRIGILRTGAE
jgi:hypothetical protein